MTELQSYTVEAFWDSESGVWVATSEDVPGLATEADTLDILSNKLRQMIPELLMLNRVVDELEDELRDEYDFSELKGGVRGKYYERFQQGNNLNTLDY